MFSHSIIVVNVMLSLEQKCFICLPALQRMVVQPQFALWSFVRDFHPHSGPWLYNNCYYLWKCVICVKGTLHWFVTHIHYRQHHTSVYILSTKQQFSIFFPMMPLGVFLFLIQWFSETTMFPARESAFVAGVLKNHWITFLFPPQGCNFLRTFSFIFLTTKHRESWFSLCRHIHRYGAGDSSWPNA